MKYFIDKKLNSSFDEAVESLTSALKDVGFGIVSEINLQEKFKEKLDIDFRKYTILGVCNPMFSLRLIEIDDKIGTMLPCSIVVQETEDGQIEIAAVDPVVSMAGIDDEKIKAIAEEARLKISEAMLSL